MEGSSSSYMVIARRYRPQRFDQVLGQDAVVATLKNAIQQGRVAQAYLFCGTRGTGKTTLARLVAKALNCPHRGPHPDPCGECQTCKEISAGISLDVLEIDGASNRGIDDIRNLTESAPYAAAGGGVKVTIIDEVHMLTKEAFNALLKTLEEPPPNLKFIFATTEPHKVPATILSRCQRFDLSRISTDVLMRKLHVIAKEMGRAVSEEALYLIASQAEGSFRDSESLLDQVLAYQIEGEVLPQMASVALGLAPRQLWFHLDQAVQEQSLEQALEIAQSIIHSGIDVTQALEQLLEHLRCHLLCQLGRLPVAMPAEWVKLYQCTTQAYQREQLLMLLDELSLLWQQARQQTPSIWTLEYALLSVVRSKSRMPMELLVRRLLDAEARLAHAAGVPNATLAQPSSAGPTHTQPLAPKVAIKSASVESPPATINTQGPAVQPQLAKAKEKRPAEISKSPRQQTESPGPVSAVGRAPGEATLFSQAAPVKAAQSAPPESRHAEPAQPAAPAGKPAGSPASGTAPKRLTAQEPASPAPIGGTGMGTLPAGRADTLMRFAAVELEGILSPPPNR